MWRFDPIMGNATIITHLLVSLVLSFALWLERELKHQPAWTRTHILIWLGSTLLMIISIMIPDLYGSTVKDHSRIAAQVVSGIWFLWAWAIIKMWMTTKWLTTAANIWTTSAIWLTVWAWLYLPAIVATCLILLNLILISKVKWKLIKKYIYWSIKMDFEKKEMESTEILSKIIKLPIDVESRDIRETSKNLHVSLVVKMQKKIDLYNVHAELKKLKWLWKISLSESIR